MSYAALARTDVPQTEPLDARQVMNNAGGYTFALDIWGRLDRFLILGSDAPTYYESARKLTRENAKSVQACWAADFRRTADRIVKISVAGRAPKNSPAIFALALGSLSTDVDARRAALDAVAKVCRTSSHLFEFAALIDALGRGWGRMLKRTVTDWYEVRSPEALGYQMAKYRERNGYSHKRLIQRVRPPAADGSDARVALYRWACGRDLDGRALPDIVVGHLDAMKAETAKELVPLIERYGLTWEAVPTWALKDADVWRALLPNLGLTALIRNLATLSDVGVTKPLSAEVKAIVERLTDPEQMRKARIHPYSVLQAHAVYRKGRSVKGERTWKVESRIVDALDQAFYLAFGNVEPTGKRHLLALDVSGSMGTNFIGDVLAAREAAAAMSMVVARTEKEHHFVGFSNGICSLDISATMDLKSVVEEMRGRPFQTTDCSAPMLHALENGIEADVFVVFTDNETYAGRMHPSKALQKYRKKTGIPAKLVVAGMTSTGFSIADPDDAGMLDVVGFDSDAVSVMADFVRS